MKRLARSDSKLSRFSGDLSDYNALIIEKDQPRHKIEYKTITSEKEKFETSITQQQGKSKADSKIGKKN